MLWEIKPCLSKNIISNIQVIFQTENHMKKEGIAKR